jgi:hypothetical protein
VRREVGWPGLHMVGSMLVGLGGLGGLALLSTPLGAHVVEVPAVYRWRPLHTWAHTWTPQGWDVSTDLSVWQPEQGCLLGRVLALPGVVVQSAPAAIKTSTQPMVGWKP